MVISLLKRKKKIKKDYLLVKYGFLIFFFKALVVRVLKSLGSKQDKVLPMNLF